MVLLTKKRATSTNNPTKQTKQTTKQTDRQTNNRRKANRNGTLFSVLCMHVRVHSCRGLWQRDNQRQRKRKRQKQLEDAWSWEQFRDQQAERPFGAGIIEQQINQPSLSDDELDNFCEFIEFGLLYAIELEIYTRSDSDAFFAYTVEREYFGLEIRA